MDEFGLIKRYFLPLCEVASGVELAIGDDAALLSPTPGMLLAVSTDTLVEGRHFRRGADPADLGWKSLAVNLSDLAAMGAEPRWFTLALTLPVADGDWLEAFASGLQSAARTYSISLVGGDTTRGPLSITITVHGEVPGSEALRRDTARVGDIICVSGTLGDAALALRSDSAQHDLLARLHRPQPRIALGLALRRLAHAAIDLSDGLVQDLGHILAASNVGAELELDRIPQSRAFRSTCPAELVAELLLAGGDDYELCVCMSPDRFAEVSHRSGVPLTRIGQVVEGPGLRVLDSRGDIMSLPQSGYRHFQ